MNTYDRNSDLKFPIVVHNDQPSEYEALVAEYKARGGRVRVIPEGFTTMSPAPVHEWKDYDGDAWAAYLNPLFMRPGFIDGELIEDNHYDTF